MEGSVPVCKLCQGKDFESERIGCEERWCCLNCGTIQENLSFSLVNDYVPESNSSNSAPKSVELRRGGKVSIKPTSISSLGVKGMDTISTVCSKLNLNSTVEERSKELLKSILKMKSYVNRTTFSALACLIWVIRERSANVSLTTLASVAGVSKYSLGKHFKTLENNAEIQQKYGFAKKPVMKEQDCADNLVDKDPGEQMIDSVVSSVSNLKPYQKLLKQLLSFCEAYCTEFPFTDSVAVCACIQLFYEVKPQLSSSDFKALPQFNMRGLTSKLCRLIQSKLWDTYKSLPWKQGSHAKKTKLIGIFLQDILNYKEKEAQRIKRRKEEKNSSDKKVILTIPESLYKIPGTLNPDLDKQDITAADMSDVELSVYLRRPSEVRGFKEYRESEHSNEGER